MLTEKKVSFLTENKAHQKEFGHMLEGIKHYTNDPRLNKMEENKVGILMANAVQDYCDRNGYSSYDEVKRVAEAQTSSSDAATFVKYNLPMQRKVYPQMISPEFVSVQPMSQPDWKMFYHDILRDDSTSLSADIHDQRDYADNEEYDPDDPTDIAEITMSIVGVSISAASKKLKEKHTIEAEQDIRAYHGIDVSNDMSNALVGEIAREWDRTILQAMLDGATGGTATFDKTIPDGLTWSDRKVYMEMIYEKMIDVDTMIFKKRYVRTNYAVVSANIGAYIEKMAGFKASSTGDASMAITTGGRYFMGTLSNRWRIYVDPFFPEKILMGYNNAMDWTRTAFVFSPYVLTWFTDPWVDPDTQLKYRSIMSRAGYRVVVPDLLGTVVVVGS